MSRYNNPREYKNEIAKYIEVLSDVKKHIEWLANEYPDKVLIWRADICERKNELNEDYEKDLSKYSWQIWAHLEDTRNKVIEIAGEENYKRYLKHMRSFDELDKWMNREVTSEEFENNINNEIEL